MQRLSKDEVAPITISTKLPTRGDPEQIKKDTEAFFANEGYVKVFPPGATGNNPLDKNIWKKFSIK